MEIRGKVYRANSLLPWFLGSNASPASLWDYSFPYILLHMKSPAQTSNELSRLNRSLTVFKCHAVIGEINLLVLGLQIHPRGRRDVLSASLVFLFFPLLCCSKCGEEQHNSLKVTSIIDTLFIQFQQNSVIF